VLSLLLILAVAAVLFVAASVATLDRDLLAEVPPDRADVVLPEGGLVADDVAAVHFGMTVRGYRMDEVDQVLDRVQLELLERDERLAELQRVLAEILEPVVAEAEHTQALAEEPTPELARAHTLEHASEWAEEQPTRVHHPVGWPG
jgi:DivIVA domain-containing protein